MKKIIKRIVSCVLFVAILRITSGVLTIFQPKSNDKAAGIHYPRATVFSANLKTVLTLYLSVTARYIIRSFRLISGGIMNYLV